VQQTANFEHFGEWHEISFIYRKSCTVDGVKLDIAVHFPSLFKPVREYNETKTAKNCSPQQLKSFK
jgi:hypothetical protein